MANEAMFATAAATRVVVGHAGEVRCAGLWSASKRGPSHRVATTQAVQTPPRLEWVAGHGAILRSYASSLSVGGSQFRSTRSQINGGRSRFGNFEAQIEDNGV
jgi:hypothetical protein